MSAWHDFDFHRLVRLPKVEQQEKEREPASRPLAAALTGAHASLLARGSGSALLTAWVRSPDDRVLRFLLGGRPFSPTAVGKPDHEGGQAVLFPPGAFATVLPTVEAAALFGRFRCWAPCAGTPDALWAPSESGQEPPGFQRGSFDQHVAHLTVPFAWVVLAEPLPPHQVQPELNQLVNEILPLSRTEVGEGRRIELERKKTRYRDLSRAQTGGAWRIRVLVGGEDPDAAISSAATLCAASEMDGQPYVLAPTGKVLSLAEAMMSTSDDAGAKVPVVAGTELLVTLARPPERELPGIRLVEPHTFDVTPESGHARGIRLGGTLDDAGYEVGTLVLDHDRLNRHTFVCGATGGGKSHTVRHLLAEASRCGLPWLVIEPAKAEYAAMADRLAPLGQDVAVIRPGDPDLPPAGFNPLEPAKGFALQTHVDLLGALFLASFESHEPFPQVLSTALTRCYEELGWDLALGTNRRAGTPRYPTLGDLQRAAGAVVTDIGYGPEVAANIGGFVKVRMGSLRTGTTGRFFEGGHRLDFDLLLGRNVVLEIQDVGDDTAKSFLMGAVLMRLTEYLRVEERAKPGKELTHLTVIEEAHRLLRKPGPGAGSATVHAVESFASLLAEVRAYGEGLVIAEQIPEKLIPDVIKNTAVKIVHRLPARDDRESVGATMNLDDRQSRYVVSLPRGEAAVFTDGMDRPLLVRMPPEGTRPSGAEPAPVGGIITRRSPTCGQDCLAQACTLKQLREAQHRLADRTWLTVWAELMVVAHLTGRPTPLIDDVQRSMLGPVSRRELDCALSHAVDDAVAVRLGQLPMEVDPGELAGHCVSVLRQNAAGATPTCDHSAFRFAAKYFRWRAVLAELERDPGTGPHPDTIGWQARYSRRIPGETRDDQIKAVTGWYESAIADQDGLDAVTFGATRPSALERAIGGTPSDATPGGWDVHVLEAVEPFGFNWPSWLLIPLTRHQDR